MTRTSVLRLICLALAGAALLAIPAYAVNLNLNAQGRTDADHDRDAYNKPEALFEFWGLHEGMRIMDLFPGDGYTTHLYSLAVGPKGKVLAFGSYDHDAFEKRMKPLNLTNVEETVLKEPEGFTTVTKELAKIPAGSLDGVYTIRNYHDLKHPPEVLAELKRILKPGGILGIADSRTTAGRDVENHRISDDLIVREVTTAGFTLTGISQMLSNPKDDYTKGFWQERWIVDQSCLKFTR